MENAKSVIVIVNPGEEPMGVESEKYLLFYPDRNNREVVRVEASSSTVFDIAAFRALVCHLSAEHGAEKILRIARQATQSATLMRQRVNNNGVDRDITCGFIAGGDA